MPLPVILDDVVNEMDGPNEVVAVLNRLTGETYAATEDEFVAAEDGEEDEEQPAAQWERDHQAKLREIVGSDDWLDLPSRHDWDEYEFMRDFAGGLSDARFGADLAGAVGGKGTFARFRDMVRRHGVETQWHEFRRRALEEIAAEWLKENGIPFVRKPEKP